MARGKRGEAAVQDDSPTTVRYRPKVYDSIVFVRLAIPDGTVTELDVHADTEHPAEVAASPALLLRAVDAAALCNTSVRTWRTWDTTGKIPRAIRIGRKVFWRPEELHAWVQAGCPDRETWEAVRQS